MNALTACFGIGQRLQIPGVRDLVKMIDKLKMVERLALSSYHQAGEVLSPNRRWSGERRMSDPGPNYFKGFSKVRGIGIIVWN
jgi:hypothetical protein